MITRSREQCLLASSDALPQMSEHACQSAHEIRPAGLCSREADDQRGSRGHGDARLDRRPPGAWRALQTKGAEQRADAPEAAFTAGAFAQFVRNPTWRQAGAVLLPLRVPGQDRDRAQRRVNPGNEPQAPVTSIEAHHARTQIRTAEEAWRIVYTYARRWHIEISWRYGTSELVLESSRLWSWERRPKVVFSATLSYAFLLSPVYPSLYAGAALAPPLLVPPHGKAEPRRLDSALSPTLGAQPPLARLPPAGFLSHLRQCGMAHTPGRGRAGRTLHAGAGCAVARGPTS
jgi:hypothetical protein